MKRSRVILSTIISSLILVGSASALEYQTNPSTGDNPVTLKFEFGSTLNITTGGNISISDLTPGTKAISASNYNVTVSTNNLTGYTLSATVGCASGTDCYDSKNLSDGTNTFSMLSADGALTAGTWGVSLDSSATTNSNFKTLAKYDETATIINQTTNNEGDPATGYTGTANTTVRVGAYATTSQVAGTYTNSINFIAVANPVRPSVLYMQDIANWIDFIDTNEEVIVKDNRDEKDYYALKMSNGHMIMTQNLDHDIVTDGSVIYDSTTTDIPSAWTPAAATITANWNIDATYYNLPESYNPGDKYWNGTVDSDERYDGTLDNTEYISNTGDTHYHVGNFYNWTAAVAMNDSSSYTADGTDIDQSICPAGWTLPTKTSGSGKVSWNDIYTAYSGTTWYSSPLYFTLTGWLGSASSEVGLHGNWWSREVKSSNLAYRSYTTVDGDMTPSWNLYRYYGLSVRCISR